MIVSVTLEKSAFKKPPHRFEAGTPNIAGAIGLAAAIDYLDGIGRAAIFEHAAQPPLISAPVLLGQFGTVPPLSSIWVQPLFLKAHIFANAPPAHA